MHWNFGWVTGALLLSGLSSLGCSGPGRTVFARGSADGSVQLATAIDEVVRVTGDGESTFVSGVEEIVEYEEQIPDKWYTEDLPRPWTTGFSGSKPSIIRREVNRLYVLSRANGLKVINVSEPAAPKVLGRYRTAAQPSDLYVENNIVFALYTGWRSEKCIRDDNCYWGSSLLQVFDTCNPSMLR